MRRSRARNWRGELLVATAFSVIESKILGPNGFSGVRDLGDKWIA